MKQLNKNMKLIFFLSGVLMLILALGGTFAYLTAESEDMVNKLTFVGGDPAGKNDMKAELIEKNWKDSDALGLIPGNNVSKDPVIKNISNTRDGVSEWVCMQISFQDGNGNKLNDGSEQLKYVLDAIEIDWNVGNGDTQWNSFDSAWVKESPASVNLFYYNSKIDQGESSEPIFSKVKIKESATTAQIEYIKTKLNGFTIEAAGGAVQGNISKAHAISVLEDLL